MKKILLLMVCLFTASASAGSLPQYNPENGNVKIPSLIIIGQKEEYLIKMQQRGEGLNFEVTEIIPNEETEDSNTDQATYDPVTRIVAIPFIAVLSNSNEESAKLMTFSVRMQQQEGMNFKVLEAIPVEFKLSTNLDKSMSKFIQNNEVQPTVMLRKPVTCGKKRYFLEFFWTERGVFQNSCPSGWFEL